MSAILVRVRLRKLLSENYALIGILLGTLLISSTVGNFQNPDTGWEFKAASGVIIWGMPFVEVQGSLINQPPLGFYAEGLFLRTFGASIETGTALIVLFGLGCSLLVYLIGKDLYGKKTGLLASALFSLTPWYIVMSNSFLIDTQCLFLSLLSLFMSILAFRRNSNRLLFIAGVFFALAFYTKLFAVLTLIPIFLSYLYLQHGKIRSLPIKLGLFCFPLLIATLTWYTVDFYMMPSYLEKGIGYMFNHSDLTDLNAPGVVPSYFVLSNFLLNYGLGYFLVTAAIFSVAFSLILRRRNSKKQTTNFDLILLAPILLAALLILYFGVTLNLKVPYTSVIKYAYQSLPYFSLIAASLTTKCIFIFRLGNINFGWNKIACSLVGVVGFLLPSLAMLVNFLLINQFSMSEFIIFSVEPGKLLGYSFNNVEFIIPNSFQIYFQYFGFLLVIAVLLLASGVAHAFLRMRSRIIK